ncbi:MAG: formylmethanofuran dehydrogenase subunit C [Alphaproteobacteria bacterium GM7ARS4]|nr:formylmethanofuran dehydrogenase subunit C [Alphaproteobacteria bacterium GM7ARS4]
MTTLTLTYRGEKGAHVDMTGLAEALERGDINHAMLKVRGLPVPLGDIFSVKGKVAAPWTQERNGALTIEAGNARLSRVGYGWRHGALHIDGNSGDDVGRGMTGGKVVIEGHAGHHAGCGMKGGALTIKKSVGDYAGGNATGGLFGMEGGVIHVYGNGGRHIGHKMRRGVILIEGQGGAYGASHMVAGTIIIMGACATGWGRGMRRGSLVMLQGKEKTLTTGAFAYNGVHALPFLNVMTRHVATLSKKCASLMEKHAVKGMARHMGDVTHMGKGEVWLPA